MAGGQFSLRSLLLLVPFIAIVVSPWFRRATVLFIFDVCPADWTGAFLAIACILAGACAVEVLCHRFKVQRLWLAFGCVVLLPLVYSTRLHDIATQESAVKRIQDLGGTCEYGNWSRDVAKSPYSAWLQGNLGADLIATVVAVDLPSVCTDDDLRFICTRVPTIERLGLARLDDDGFRCLAELRHLRALIVQDSFVTDFHWKLLESLPRLERLELHGEGVTDGTLAAFPMLRTLKELNLDRTSVTDDGMPRIVSQAPELRTLSLCKTLVADEGMRQVSQLAGLTTLMLDQTRVSDSAMPHLRNLKNLCWLQIVRTRVSRSGVAQLREAIPQLRTKP